MPLTESNQLSGRVYAFSGAQGTGKTTAARAWAAKLGAKDKSFSVGLVVDVERECPYQINQECTHEAQSWIFREQMERELQALSKHDLVVTDRTLMDVIAYSMRAGFDAQVSDMLKIWRRHEYHYGRIILRSIVTNPYNYSDGVRDTDLIFRAEIEAILAELYRHAGLFCQSRFSKV